MARHSITRVVALASAAAAPAGAAVAAAEPAMAMTTVTAWTHGDVKAGPGNNERTVSFVNAGYTYSGICRAYGDALRIPVGSDTHSKWVKPQLNSGGQGWVPGAYLRGNDTGGVPNQC